MEQAYWLRRQREELALAGYTTCAEAKLIHLDLAGRYSVKAGEEALRSQVAPRACRVMTRNTGDSPMYG